MGEKEVIDTQASKNKEEAIRAQALNQEINRLAKELIYNTEECNKQKLMLKRYQIMELILKNIKINGISFDKFRPEELIRDKTLYSTKGYQNFSATILNEAFREAIDNYSKSDAKDLDFFSLFYSRYKMKQFKVFEEKRDEREGLKIQLLKNNEKRVYKYIATKKGIKPEALLEELEKTSNNASERNQIRALIHNVSNKIAPPEGEESSDTAGATAEAKNAIQEADTRTVIKAIEQLFKEAELYDSINQEYIKQYITLHFHFWKKDKSKYSSIEQYIISDLESLLENVQSQKLALDTYEGKDVNLQSRFYNIETRLNELIEENK